MKNYIGLLGPFFILKVYFKILSFTLTSLYYLLNFSYISFIILIVKKPTLINKVGFYKLINLRLLQL